MQLHEPPAVLTVAETARLLRLGRNQAYAAIKSGQIRAIRIGSSYRVPRAAIEELLGGSEPAAETYRAADR